MLTCCARGIECIVCYPDLCTFNATSVHVNYVIVLDHMAGIIDGLQI